MPTFSPHASMYLAWHVGAWNYPKIGRFYYNRHHTTVIAAVRKIERLRDTDESVDALLSILTATLSPDMTQQPTGREIEMAATRTKIALDYAELGMIRATIQRRNLALGWCGRGRRVTAAPMPIIAE